MAYISGFNEAVIAAANTYLATGGLTPTFTSVTVTGGTVTTSTPVFNATQTWNNGAVAFTGAKLNVTDTASAAGSLLMDLQVGGSSKFSVTKTGEVTAVSRFVAPFYYVNSNTGAIFFGASLDTVIQRDGAANTLALRNGTSAQAFNVYNTYTDASNYERASIGWIGNQFLITTYSAGTGAGRSMFVGTTNSGSSVFLGTAGTNRWEVNSSGHLLAGTDNTYDIGATAGNRPRRGYFGTSIQAPYFVSLNGTGQLSFPTDGVFKLENGAGSNNVTMTIGASNLLTLNGGLKTTGATFALQTATTLTDNAAAQVATMTNGPAAGNPTKWIAINDNGTTRYIPAW